MKPLQPDRAGLDHTIRCLNQRLDHSGIVVSGPWKPLDDGLGFEIHSDCWPEIHAVETYPTIRACFYALQGVIGALDHGITSSIEDPRITRERMATR